MTQRLSELFGVPQDVWDATGAFDAFEGVDARLHIDPHLLASSEAPEFKEARAAFESHFRDVITLLKHASTEGDPFFRKAVRRLTFKELPYTGLGYSKHGKQGSGIGEGLARDLARLGKQIVEAGLTDPDIFALMGLLQDGIGADRISDMTAEIVLPSVLAFTERVASTLGLPVGNLVFDGRTFKVPVLPGTSRSVLLLPRDVLRHLPVANSWSEIDVVASHNEQLRNRVNEIIGRTWKQAVRVPKRLLREVLLREPDLLRDLLRQYKSKPAAHYDFAADPQMVHLWHRITRRVAAEAPLSLTMPEAPTCDDVVEVVRRMVDKFKRQVERNRLYRLFYNDNGTPRREKAAQLALFGVADAYCEANDLDLSPEVDSGNGPVDFKVSRGYHCRVLAEVKLSTNPKLIAGFDKQVKAYEDAEGAYHSFYVVVRVDDNEDRINRLRARHQEVRQAGCSCPELVIIDGRPTPSASKR